MIIELKIPAIGESITEVTISKWLVSNGDFVKMDQAVAEIESEKATVELNATQSGIISIVISEGNDLKIGDIAATINSDGIEQAKVLNSEQDSLQPVNLISNNEEVNSGKPLNFPSPAAKKIIAEKNLNISKITGSGKDGRITKEDALLANPNNIEQDTIANIGEGNDLRNQRREKMSNLRKAVAKRLVMAKNETAMLTTFNEVNMQPIMDIRSKYKEKFKEKHDIGLGFMSFFIRACVLALKKHPAVNAYIDGTDILYNDFYDISIAVSGPKGLMVPVIRNAETYSLWDIEKQVSGLALKARDNKLSIEEMTGGTFTISNGGVFGSMLSTPILNPPQSAILGMHNIIERPIAQNGQVVIKPMMYLALSYDHRIIDGRESVGYLVYVKQLLENPEQLLNGVSNIDLLMGL